MNRSFAERPLWFTILVLLLIPIAGMALGVAVTLLSGIAPAASNLVINLGLLAAVFGLILLFKPTRREMGLQLIPAQLARHVISGLLILTLYLLFYLGVIQISGLRALDTAVWWGLITQMVVVIAEELYFRGLFYGFIEKRVSARAALIFSSVLFGLFHARQGLRGIVAKLFTGWLWGSVRYTSGMVFLIIFPIHFAYNTIWLLFAGNWENPPPWSLYGVPAAEFLLGAAFVVFHHRGSRQQ